MRREFNLNYPFQTIENSYLNNSQFIFYRVDRDTQLTSINPISKEFQISKYRIPCKYTRQLRY